MKDSLESKTSLYSGLLLQQIVVIIDVLYGAEFTVIEHIRRRFLERASEFEATVAFLTEIGLILCKDDQVKMEGYYLGNTAILKKSNLVREIVSLMIQRENRYRAEAFEYLGRFRVINGNATYRPNVMQSSDESAVRNFMMELGIVLYDKPTASYIISSEGVAVFAQAKCCSDRFSQSALQASQRAQEEIGIAAENAVVSYERQRVGPQFAGEVDHVACRDVSAGYDVRSVSFSVENEVLPRYIEVKAVPQETYRFYWTANEQNVARVFGTWYYLYLLPVGRGGDITLENLLIICDPCTAVLESHSDWVIEKNVLRCSLKSSLTRTSY